MEPVVPAAEASVPPFSVRPLVPRADPEAFARTNWPADSVVMPV